MLHLLFVSLTSAVSPAWTAGAGYLSDCARTTQVFGVPICVTQAAYNSGETAKINHIANVMAQLLDNDADGVVDDSAVVNKMVSDNYFLFVALSESDSESASFPSQGRGQLSGIWEAWPNACDVPTNRGATTDRSTWAAALDPSNGCRYERDATTEEILHLITEAASELWPSKWGKSYSSSAGAALNAANGNCGWGYSNNWIDPGSKGCSGQYAYDDDTCDVGCIVVEGIYWASISYIGGLYYNGRASSIAREWLMPTPDDGMTLIPSGVDNARTLQNGSPALYELISDTTSTGHAWLPATMPDGNYQGNATAAFGAGSTPIGGGGGGSGGDEPCFPSAASVRSADGTLKRVDSLKEGDEIVVAFAEGTLGTDTVSLLSIAKPEAAAASYVALTTALNTTLTLTPGHHLPVGKSCCSTLKVAEDVEIGDQLWATEAGAVVAAIVTAKATTKATGLHSPVPTHGGFPIVNGVVTAFDSIEKVTLAKHGLAPLLKVCKATATCERFRKMFLHEALEYVAPAQH